MDDLKQKVEQPQRNENSFNAGSPLFREDLGGGPISPFKKGGMFDQAHPLIFERAKQLRKNMTDAEKILWGYLKSGLNGLKFR